MAEFLVTAAWELVGSTQRGGCGSGRRSEGHVRGRSGETVESRDLAGD